VRIAAYQARLQSWELVETVRVIAEQVATCERAGVDVLCCPEAVLGGLADYASDPHALALRVDDGSLQRVLAPLESSRVTTIVGFTESGVDGCLYNSAAVFSEGRVAGIYRKLHPAIRSSVYSPGHRLPLFETNGVRFGIVICRDSTFAEPAKRLAAQGAQILFVPTNNGLPPGRASRCIVDEARQCDIKWAGECGMYVVRADVAGEANGLVSHGSSAIVGPQGTLLQTADSRGEELLVADFIDAVR
jgi:predicted amidohydrolase